MKKICPLIFLLLGLFVPDVNSQNNPDSEEWIPLFNGKNLEHWIPKIKGYETGENFGNTFRVEDGMVTVAYDAYEDFDSRFGHLFYDQPFSYYKLRVEYRFTGEQAPKGPGWAFRNSGIMIHGQPPESMAVDQDFPISIEVQLLGGDGKAERTTANLCTPGTHVKMNGELTTTHCITSNSKTYHGDQWVHVEILAYGDSLIQHFVEGDMVIEYTHPQVGGEVVNDYNDWAKIDGTLLEGGSISLQSESHPVQFRKVELLNLVGCMDPAAKNYKSYYLKADNNQCRY
ncbi:MAG: DUF1080 domain-containing protein [Cyclobacteriaceae bacterium]|nr:DUF1080 domain-containing protein [Cyclobacteriaceae bacterium]